MHLTNSTSVKKVLIYLVVILAIIFAAAYLWLTNANNYQRSGTIDFHINEAPIQSIVMLMAFLTYKERAKPM